MYIYIYLHNIKRLQYTYNNISGTSPCFALTIQAVQCRTGNKKNETNTNRHIERVCSRNGGCETNIKKRRLCACFHLYGFCYVILVQS